MNPLDRNVGLNRREFFTLLTGASIAFCAGCKSLDNGGGPPAGKTTVIDAGPAADYAAEGVYSTFTEEGFFVIRHQGKLLAISSICTHRSCILDAEPDHSFFCHCHGSTFSPDGKVTEGPATRNLPMLETSLGPNGHLLVRVVS
jgi:cytochrome b6-f complex iron-sulfur subunit